MPASGKQQVWRFTPGSQINDNPSGAREPTAEGCESSGEFEAIAGFHANPISKHRKPAPGTSNAADLGDSRMSRSQRADPPANRNAARMRGQGGRQV